MQRSAAAPLGAIEVSYGSALLPSPFRRVVNASGIAVNVNQSSGAGTPAFVWTRVVAPGSGGDEAPMVDVRVLYDEEPTPPGFRRVSKALTPGSTSPVFLAYLCAGEGAAADAAVLVGLHVVEGDEAPGGGAQLLDRPLNRDGGPPIRLAMTRVGVVGLAARGADAAAASAWLAALKVGDYVDCLDKVKRWRVARVTAISPDGSQLDVTFKGWSNKHDEALPRAAAAARLARPGTHTAGKDTRGIRRQGETFAVDLEVLASLELRLDELMGGEFPPEERDTFCRGELPAYLEAVLSAKYDSDALRDRINSFNQKVLALCVWHMKRVDEPLPPEIRQHLSRLFLDDTNCNYYFAVYGGMKPTDSDAGKYEGEAARLPTTGASRYYVANVNFFAGAGGYDAILARLTAANIAGRRALEGGGGGGSGVSTAAPVLPSSASGAAVEGEGASTISSGNTSTAAAAATSGGSSSTSEDPLADAFVFGSVVTIPKACYTEAWARTYFQPLRDALYERTLTLTDAQLKRTSKDAVDLLGKRLHALGFVLTNEHYSHAAADIIAGPEQAGAADGISITAAQERWSMARAARLLRCDSLALRVKGVTDIKDLAEHLALSVSALISLTGPGTLSTSYSSGSSSARGSRSAAGQFGRTTNSYNNGGLVLFSSTTRHSDGGRAAALDDARPVFPSADVFLSQSSSASWFDVPRFLRFIATHRIIELILGAAVDAGEGTAAAGGAAAVVPTVHVQTLTRAAPLFTFMAAVTGAVANGRVAFPQTGVEGPSPALSVSVVSTAAAASFSASLTSFSSSTTAAAAASAATHPTAMLGLTPRHVALLFQVIADGGYDDSLRRAVYDIVAGISRYLPVDLLDVAYAHLNAIPVRGYDEATVALLKGFTANALLTAAAAAAVVPPAVATIVTREEMDSIDEEEEGDASANAAAAAAAICSGNSVATAIIGVNSAVAAPHSATAAATMPSPPAPDSASDFPEDPHNWFALPNLWRAALERENYCTGTNSGSDDSYAPDDDDAAYAPPSAVGAARDAIVDLCRSRPFQATVLVSKCANNVTAGVAVYSSLLLLDALLKSMSDKERTRLHKSLMQPHGASPALQVALLADIQRFHEAARRAAGGLKSPNATAASAAAVAPLGDAVLVGRQPYIKGLSVRLTFLVEFLSSPAGCPALTLHDADALWRALVDRALCAEDRDSAMAFLLMALGEGVRRSSSSSSSAATVAHARRAADVLTAPATADEGGDGGTGGSDSSSAAVYCYNSYVAAAADGDVEGAVLPPAVAIGVAESLFFDPARLPVEIVGAVAFTAFEMFFRAANGFAGRLQPGWQRGEPSVDRSGVVVAVGSSGSAEEGPGWDLRLDGLERLWDIVLHATSPPVYAAAAKFLLDLYCNLPSEEDIATAAQRAADGLGPAAAIDDSEDHSSAPSFRSDASMPSTSTPSFLNLSIRGTPIVIPPAHTLAAHGAFESSSHSIEQGDGGGGVSHSVDSLDRQSGAAADDGEVNSSHDNGVGGTSNSAYSALECRRGVWEACVRRCLAAIASAQAAEAAILVNNSAKSSSSGNFNSSNTSSNNFNYVNNMNISSSGSGSSSSSGGSSNTNNDNALARARRIMLHATQLLTDLFASIDAAFPYLVRTGGRRYDEDTAPPPRIDSANGGYTLDLEGPDISAPAIISRDAPLLVWVLTESEAIRLAHEAQQRVSASGVPPEASEGPSGASAESGGTKTTAADVAPVPRRLVMRVRPAVETFGAIRDRIADAVFALGGVTSSDASAVHVRLCFSSRSAPDMTMSGSTSYSGAGAANASSSPVTHAATLGTDGLPLQPSKVAISTCVKPGIPGDGMDGKQLGTLKNGSWDLCAVILDSPDANLAAHVYCAYQRRLRQQHLLTLRELARDSSSDNAYLLPRDEDDLELSYQGWRETCAAEWAVMTAPRRAISDSPEAFDTVFRLLSSAHPDIVSSAWGLLQLLPTNHKAEEDIRTCCGRYPLAGTTTSAAAAAGAIVPAAADYCISETAAAVAATVDWCAIFDGGSPLRLLYSLKILARHLRSISAAAAPTLSPYDEGSEDAATGGIPPIDMAASPWLLAFIRSGGARHLLHVFMSADLEALLGPMAPNLYQEAIKLLVEVVTALLLGPGGRLQLEAVSPPDEAVACALDAAAADPVIGRLSLLRRLLQLLGYVAARHMARRIDDGAAQCSAAPPPVSAPHSSGLGEDISSESYELHNAATAISSDSSGGSSNSGGDSAQRACLSIVRCVMDVLPPLLLQSPSAGEGAQQTSTFTTAQQALDEFCHTRDSSGVGIVSVGASKPCDSGVLVLSMLAPSAPAVRAAVGNGLRKLWEAAERAGSGRIAHWLLHTLLNSLPTAMCFPDMSEVYFASLLLLLKPPVAGGAAGASTLASSAAGGAAPRSLTRCTDTRCSCYAGVAARAPDVSSALDDGERAVFAALAHAVAAHPIVEVGSDDNDVKDTVLIALLGVLEAAVVGRSPRIIEWVAWEDGSDATARASTPVVEEDAAAPAARTTAMNSAASAATPPLPGLNLVFEVFDRCLFALPSATPTSALPTSISSSAAASALTGTTSSTPSAAGAAAAAAAAADPPSISILGGELPKCKSGPARRAAFSLLSALCRGSLASCARIAAKILPHHDAEAAAAAAAAAAKPGSTHSSSSGLTVSSSPAIPSYGARGSRVGEDDEDAGSGAAPDFTPKRLRFNLARGSPGAKAHGGVAPMHSPLVGRSGKLVPVRSSTGYVGLRNMGCICFMNATLQQFFMTPELRRAILAWEEGASPGSTERDDSVMYQLQRLFAYLQESEKQFYNPRGLCYAVKWDGCPTGMNVNEQQDVPEFLTKLFADMETQCQGTPSANAVKDVFGGVWLNELFADNPRATAAVGVASSALLSDDAGGSSSSGGSPAAVPVASSPPPPLQLYSAKEEDFTWIQLVILNHRTVEDALQAFVAGETITDYKWTLPAAPTAADSGVAAAAAASAATLRDERVALRTTKRYSLRSAGEYLMLHLNRFEFDYDAEQQVKLNDRCEFPRVLDLWKYTVGGRTDAVQAATRGAAAAAPSLSLSRLPSGDLGAAAARAAELERASFRYEIVGVVVHLGTAVGGHYWSYRREYGAGGTTPGDRWLEFNDQLVCPWAATDAAFDKDCFGGVDHVTGSGGRFTSSYAVHERVRNASAFCLFYKRQAVAPVGGGGGSDDHAAAAGAAEKATQQYSAASCITTNNGDGGHGEGEPASSSSSSNDGGIHSSSSSGGNNAPLSSPIASVHPHDGSLSITLPASPLDAFASALRLHYGDTRGRRVRASVRAPMPPDLLQEIRTDNLEFWRLKTIFEISYFAFVQGLIKDAATLVAAPADAASGTLSPDSISITGAAPLCIVRLATAFILNTLTDSNQMGKAEEWLAITTVLLRSNPTAAGELLLRSCGRESAEFWRQLVGMEPNAAGGTSSTYWSTSGSGGGFSSTAGGGLQARLCGIALEVCWRAAVGEQQLRGASSSGSSSNSHAVCTASSHAFVTMLLDQLPLLLHAYGNLHWHALGPYFQLLGSFAAMGPLSRDFLHAKGALGRVIDFVLCGNSPHPELNAPPPPPPHTSSSASPVSVNSSPQPQQLGAKGKFATASPSALALPPSASAAVPTSRGVRANTLAIDSAPPDLESVWLLLVELLMSRAPPSGAQRLSPPQPLLSPVDLDMVASPQFLLLLTIQMGSSSTAARHLTPLLTHILWGSAGGSLGAGEEQQQYTADAGPAPPPAASVVTLLAHEIAMGVEATEYDDMKPFFRVAAVAVSVTGDDATGALQRSRVDAVMGPLIAAITRANKFVKATEAAIEFLTKLAKRRPLVCEWLGAHRDEWDWMEEWLRVTERPPVAPFTSGSYASYSTSTSTRSSSGSLSTRGEQLPPGMRSLKRTPATSYYSSASGNQFSRNEFIAPNIKRLLAPAAAVSSAEAPAAEAAAAAASADTAAALFFEMYESDDEPESAIGKRVTLWSGSNSKQHRGLVEGFSIEHDAHIVRLDAPTSPDPILVQLSDTRRWLVCFEEPPAAAAAAAPVTTAPLVSDVLPASSSASGPLTSGARGSGNVSARHAAPPPLPPFEVSYEDDEEGGENRAGDDALRMVGGDFDDISSTGQEQNSAGGLGSSIDGGSVAPNDLGEDADAGDVGALYDAQTAPSAPQFVEQHGYRALPALPSASAGKQLPAAGAPPKGSELPARSLSSLEVD